MITTLEQSGAPVIGADCHGKIAPTDYAELLRPMFPEAIKGCGTIPMLHHELRLAGAASIRPRHAYGRYRAFAGIQNRLQQSPIPAGWNGRSVIPAPKGKRVSDPAGAEVARD